MATNSVDLLSVIPGITVSSSDILQAELLLSQTLTAQDPTLDIRTGTAVRDLCIRPSATLLATINKALVYYWTQNSLQNVDDLTPTVFVDKILQNFFMTRFSGSKTVINVRLFFAKQTSVTLTTDIYFSTDGVMKYFPVVSATYGQNQLIFDPSVNQYYLSVDMVAENTGAKYNISSGSLIYFSNFNPFFLHAEINYLSALATDSETNTQFIERARDAISTRNLINIPSIKGNLLQAFPIISDVYSIGMGDLEMIRDKVQVIPPETSTSLWIHIGGCTDIYVKVPIVSAVVQFTTDSVGRISLTGSIFKTMISSIPGGPLTDEISISTPYKTTNQNSIILTPTVIERFGTIVKVTSNNHGLSVGERFVLGGADQSQYNGIFKVESVVDGNIFTYSINSTPITPATGIFSLTIVNRTYDFGFSTKQSLVLDFAELPKTIVSATAAANVVTIGCVDHGYETGDEITIEGLSIPSYNGVWIITRISQDLFSYSTTTTTNPVLYAAAATKTYAEKNVSIELFYHQGLDGIQTYLSDSNNRVLSSDQLARGFNLILLDISIIGYGAIAPNQATASKAVTEYLDSLAPGQTFIMADLLSLLYAAGITTIQTPLSITYTRYYRDLLGETYGVITDILNPKDSTGVFMLNSLTTSVATP